MKSTLTNTRINELFTCIINMLYRLSLMRDKSSIYRQGRCYISHIVGQQEAYVIGEAVASAAWCGLHRAICFDIADTEDQMAYYSGSTRSAGNRHTDIELCPKFQDISCHDRCGPIRRQDAF